MHMIHHPEHPAWDDPRCCSTIDPDATDHRSAPYSLRSTLDGSRFTVGVAQVDAADLTGDATVHVEVSELVHRCGADLTAADARMLAALLVTAADLLDDVVVTR